MENYLADNWLDKNGTELFRHDGRAWKCIKTNKGTEVKVAQFCYINDIPYFLPAYTDSAARKFKSIWPDYIYACLNGTDTYKITERSEVQKIINIPNEEKELEYLRNYKELNSISDLTVLSVNDTVEITEGSLKGLVGKIIKINNAHKKVVLKVEEIGLKLTIEISTAVLKKIRSKIEDSTTSKEIETSIRISVKSINEELIKYLQKDPSLIYNLSPDNFEKLIADLLSDMGYEVQLTPKTRDGGKDILAELVTPIGKILTIVECKRYSPERKIGIAQIERLLWVAKENEKANTSMLVTSSFFSQDAKKLGKNYFWTLKLKDFNNICEWLDKFGTWKKDPSANIWLPNYSVINPKIN